MKRNILFFIGLMITLIGNAQNVMQVLDKASAAFKSCPSVNVEFEISVGGDTDNGTILLQGNKFCTKLSNTTTWFDGKTMWSFVKDNEEVNVTIPTAVQVAKINPYAFLNIYKNGYNMEFGANTKTYYEVVLTATTSKSSIKKALIHISRFDNHPMYIMMGGSKADVEINVKSFTKGKKQSDTAFRFNKAKYPNVDVIDLR